MAYSNQMLLKAGTATLTATAGTSVYKMVVPAGLAFRLQGIVQRVTTVVLSDEDKPALNILKGTDVLKTTTPLDIDAAVTTTVLDRVSETSAATNRFKAGDTLDIQIETAAASTGTPTGAVQVDLLIALENV